MVRESALRAGAQHIPATRHDAAPPPHAPHAPPFPPSYVLYWLVRAAPGHMLRLQAGRFDAPDRLFGGVAEAWASASSAPTDVKELIPEFFMPGAPCRQPPRQGMAQGISL